MWLSVERQKKKIISKIRQWIEVKILVKVNENCPSPQGQI